MNQQQIEALKSIQTGLIDLASKIDTLVKPKRNIILRFNDKDQPCTSEHSLKLFPNDDIIIVNMPQNYLVYSLVKNGELVNNPDTKEALQAVYFVLHHLDDRSDKVLRNKLIDVMGGYVKKQYPELVAFLNETSDVIPDAKTLDDVKLMTKTWWTKGRCIIFERLCPGPIKMASKVQKPLLEDSEDDKEVAKAVREMMINGMSPKFLNFIKQ